MGPQDDNEGWVTIATYMNGLEAHVARSKLESEGIAVSLADEAVVRMNWLWSNAVGGVKVRVKPSEQDRARRILSESTDDSALEEEALRDQPAKVLPFPEASLCPHCGSARFRRSRLFDRIGAFFGVLFMSAPLPRGRRRRCVDCGKWR